MLEEVVEDAKNKKLHNVENLPKKAGDPSQLFTKKGKTIYCNGGKQIDDQYYVLMSHCDDWVYCGPMLGD